MRLPPLSTLGDGRGGVRACLWDRGARCSTRGSASSRFWRRGRRHSRLATDASGGGGERRGRPSLALRQPPLGRRISYRRKRRRPLDRWRRAVGVASPYRSDIYSAYVVATRHLPGGGCKRHLAGLIVLELSLSNKAGWWRPQRGCCCTHIVAILDCW